MVKYGIAALAGYGIHAAFHLFHGQPEDMLWMCHLGAAIVGLGLILSSPVVNGIGTLFLCLGTPTWIMYLAGGGEFIPTSLFTHVGGLVIGLFGVRRLGLPSGTFWKAALGLAALILICRLVTPASANVNLAFAVYPGWGHLFPSHLVYIAIVLCSAVLYFFVVEFVLSRWLVPRSAQKGKL